MKNDRACLECGEPVENSRTSKGRPARYCSNACRQRAYRLRKSFGASEPRPNSAFTTYGILPHRADVLVGRQQELRDLDALFDTSRVVTLFGQAGIGKTRLALEYTKRAAVRFAETISLDAESVTDADLTPSAVLTAFCGRYTRGETLHAQTGDPQSTPRRRILGHLDGCDHRSDACERLIKQLLADCPELSLLVTCRQPLGLPGESSLRVGPLALPERGPGHTASVLLQSDATLLFVERARAVDQHFRLDSGNLAGIVDVCRRLEGIPLAVEQAARWVRLLSIEDIQVALDDLMTFLPAEGGREEDGGEGSAFSTVIGGSHSLLRDDEVRMSRRLSVFPSHFGVEAATAVCADEGEGPGGVLKTLLALESRSLLQEAGKGEGGVRFQQAGPLRAYELQRLRETGEFDWAHERLVQWLMGVAEPFYGPHIPPSAETAPVCREMGALLRGAQWMLEREDSRVQALAPALARSFLERGEGAEARRMLDRALAVPGPENEYRASTEWVAAWHAFGEGDYRRALKGSLEAVRMERALDRPARLILALALAAACHLELEEPAAGAALCEEAVRLLAEVEEPVAWIQAALGIVEVQIYLGDEDAAEDLLDRYRMQTVRAFSGEGSANSDILAYGRERADMLSAQIAIARGDMAHAERLLIESLTRNAGHMRRVWLVYGLAIVSSARGYHFRTLLCAELLKRWPASTGLRVERWWRTRLEAALVEAGSVCAPAKVFKARRLASELTVDGLGSWFKQDAVAVPSSRPAQPLPQLTPREHQVVLMLSGGMTNYQMARRIGVSIRTVESHLDNVRQKTGLRSRVEIGIWAQEELESADRVRAFPDHGKTLTAGR
ncbi:LuxR C-terminal-related transcriptional regulator [Streptomyces sp. SID12501]|uniref:HTH luxR-type domain-containing protein n=1 Tax=Streptomyces sp. SID12501 TaxID=2706042 RepID=A0A6B3C4H1_9ACTN|nr:LuxR C-terminal-related transcriptional regulator [Streptomyces sp. SID12501]NEC91731.1 hypothetical protein [Streptomyces sp. SID12501]